MVLANSKKATMWTAIQKHTVTDTQFKNSRAANVLSKLSADRENALLYIFLHV